MIKPKKSKNPKPNGDAIQEVSDGAVKEKKTTTCRLCSKKIRSTFVQHLSKCPATKTVEKERKCKFCRRKQPESQSLMHEVSCRWNPNRVSKKSGLGQTQCPKCKAKFNSLQSLKLHLSYTCLDILKDAKVSKVGNNKEKSKSGNEKEKEKSDLDAIKEKLINSHLAAAGNKTSSSSGRGAIYKCVYCPGANSGLSKKKLYKHAMNCDGIPLLELKRKCPFCNKSMAFSKSYVHEVTCYINPFRVAKNKKDQENLDRAFRCPRCSKASFRKMSQFKNHLALKCLEHLKKMTRKSIRDGLLKSPASPKKTPAPPGGSDEAGGGGRMDHVQCNHCFGYVLAKRQAIECHLIRSCKAFQDLEPTRACGMGDDCLYTGPESRCYLHESLHCRFNMCRPVLDKYQQGKIRCTRCRTTVYSVGTLKHHLAKHCLDNLKESLKNSIEHLLAAPRTLALNMDATDDWQPDPGELTNVNDNDNQGQEEPDVLARNVLEQNEGGDVKTEPEPEMVIQESYSQQQQQQQQQPIAVVEPAFKCPFCHKDFTTEEDLRRHPVVCKGIKFLEPKKGCRHCSLALPVSLCGLHEMVCLQNPWRMPLMAGNLDTSDIFCPECKTVQKASKLPDHLSSCLEIMSKTLTHALSYPGYSWYQDIYVDYISRAGLDFWLSTK